MIKSIVLFSFYISANAFPIHDCETEKQQVIFLKKQLKTKPENIVYNLSLTSLDKDYNKKNISYYKKHKKTLSKISDHKRLFLAHSLLKEKKSLTDIKKILNFKSDILAVEYQRQTILSEIYFLDKNFKKSKNLIESILSILNEPNTKKKIKPYNIDLAEDGLLTSLADIHLRMGIFDQSFFIKKEKLLPKYDAYGTNLSLFLQSLKSPFLSSDKYMRLSKKAYKKCPYDYGFFDSYVRNLFNFGLLKEAKVHILQGFKNFTYIDIEIYIILVQIYINEGNYKKANKIIEKIEKYEDIGLI
ncbi:MAG: hypothetical protein OXJ52_06600, partial [Oligoflexia bacterium]|nr:hypothetical protein [Oligoflexia bacterium]